MIDEKTQEELKEQLLKEKKDIERQLNRFADKDPENKENYVTRFPDQGQELDDDNPKEYETYERNIGIEHELELELQKINSALEKMEKNRYGICDNCNKEIHPERLQAYPQAVNCLECKQQKA